MNFAHAMTELQKEHDLDWSMGQDFIVANQITSETVPAIMDCINGLMTFESLVTFVRRVREIATAA